MSHFEEACIQVGRNCTHTHTHTQVHTYKYTETHAHAHAHLPNPRVKNANMSSYSISSYSNNWLLCFCQQQTGAFSQGNSSLIIVFLHPCSVSTLSLAESFSPILYLSVAPHTSLPLLFFCQRIRLRDMSVSEYV